MDITTRCDTYADELQEIYELQHEIEMSEELLGSHPATRFSKKLIVQKGKQKGELRSDDYCKRKFGYGYDEISQDLGYEKDEVPAIGSAPSYDMVADERFKHDLSEIHRLGNRLKEMKSELQYKQEELKDKLLGR